jgi:hypothetical protein
MAAEYIDGADASHCIIGVAVRKETVKKQWQPKSRNPVSIGDNSQGNGTAGRLPI